MGLDLHAWRFITQAARTAPLGDVLTIGRQAADFDPARFGLTPPPGPGARYCEWALLALGAGEVASVDVSDYEGATYVADLGDPVTLPRQFDMVIDSGSLEHVFDVATALRNVIGFARPGGRIIHVLPVNNLSGHGFWQFSADLFHALYTAPNGFADTRVCYASSINAASWWEVPAPAPGQRTELVSLEPVVVLVVTTKAAEVAKLSVNQAFYQISWADSAVPVRQTGSGLRHALAPLRRWRSVRWARNAWTVLALALGISGYSLRNGRFVRHDAAAGDPAA